MEVNEKSVFFFSLLIVALSGAAVLCINHVTGTRKDRISKALIEQFWGFSPSMEATARYQFYVWSWRKLILAGVMLSSLCLAVTCRMANLQIAIQASSTLFSIWIASFTLFWYFYIKPYWIEQDTLKSEKGKSNDKEKVSSGWNAKILHRADMNDDRLPLTVVTGYL